MAFDLWPSERNDTDVYFQAIYGQFLFVLVVFSEMLLRQTTLSELDKLIVLQCCSQQKKITAIPRIFHVAAPPGPSLVHPNPLFWGEEFCSCLTDLPNIWRFRLFNSWLLFDTGVITNATWSILFYVLIFILCYNLTDLIKAASALKCRLTSPCKSLLF